MKWSVNENGFRRSATRKLSWHSALDPFVNFTELLFIATTTGTSRVRLIDFPTLVGDVSTSNAYAGLGANVRSKQRNDSLN